MNNQFIVLTTTENTEVIVGLANIAFIESNKEEPSKTKITLNFARGSDTYPKTLTVKESFTEVKSMLGL